MEKRCYFFFFLIYNSFFSFFFYSIFFLNNKIRDVEIGLAPNKRGKDQSKTKITPPIASEPARITIDLKFAKQLTL